MADSIDYAACMATLTAPPGTALDPFAGPLPDALPPAPVVGEPGPEHDRAVVAALYRAAVGGEVWEEKIDKFGQVTRVRREVLPDVAAARKWLESRRPEAWGAKVTQEFRVVVSRLEGQERPAVGLAIEGEAVEIPSPHA